MNQNKFNLNLDVLSKIFESLHTNLSGINA